MSGLKINFDKSEVMMTGVTDGERCRLANLLNYRLGKFPMKYLGLPVSDAPLRVADWVSSPIRWVIGLTLGKVYSWP
jgi:hypothetical protein